MAAQADAATRLVRASAFVEGPRLQAQRQLIQGLFGHPVQRRVYEATVTRPSEAVAMNSEGSIHDGRLWRDLQMGEYLRVDDADAWRSSRGIDSKEVPRPWLGLRRLGTQALTDARVYVPQRDIQAASETESLQVGEALQIGKDFGDEVNQEVERICKALNLERKDERLPSSPAHVVLYFAWLAKIGERLGHLMPELQDFVAQRIERLVPEPSEEQLNEDTEQGMALDRNLIEPINQRLKVWAMVLSGDGNEVLESLIDASGGGLHLGPAMQGVLSRDTRLQQTVGDYLRLGLSAINSALSKMDPLWTKELRSTLESVSGCYAAQAQAVERVQPKKADDKPFDPNYQVWKLPANEVGYMGLDKKGVEVERMDDVEVGDLLTSAYINPGFDYRVTAKSAEGLELTAIRQ